MKSALIGFSGFVGSTLLRQTAFTSLYRSTNIGDIEIEDFDLVVCAGASAEKWLANKEPEDDLKNINDLIEHLKKVRCKRFILISTVDVFRQAGGVDEETLVELDGLHAYGRHRRLLEIFVEETFSSFLIVRLPGLVGPGLRKNVIFDFLNKNNLDEIDHRGVFQFYPMVNLWGDIQTALNAGLELVHLTAQPLSVGTVSRAGFGVEFSNELSRPLANYDMQTKHAVLFGGAGRYQYSARETIQAVRSYAQSEPVLAKTGTGGRV